MHLRLLLSWCSHRYYYASSQKILIKFYNTYIYGKDLTRNILIGSCLLIYLLIYNSNELLRRYKSVAELAHFG